MWGPGVKAGMWSSSLASMLEQVESGNSSAGKAVLTAPQSHAGTFNSIFEGITGGFVIRAM